MEGNLETICIFSFMNFVTWGNFEAKGKNLLKKTKGNLHIGEFVIL